MKDNGEGRKDVDARTRERRDEIGWLCDSPATSIRYM